MRKATFVVGCGLVLGAICASSCVDATQASLHVSTSAACATEKGPDGLSITNAFVYIGSTFKELAVNEESHNAVAEITCEAMKDAKKPSTLILVPGNKSKAFVRVVAGTQLVSGGPPVSTLAGRCGPSTNGSCIRATRQFTYVPHTTVTLPIVLDPSCVGATCGPEETCVEGGRCRGSTCPEGIRDCQTTSLIGRGDAGAPPPADGGADASADATVEAHVPYSWPDAGARLFACSDEKALWNAPCFVGSNCYEPATGGFACDNANLCASPLFLACCGPPPSAKLGCCLAKGTLHPIVTELDPELRDKYCENVLPLCFSENGCKVGKCNLDPRGGGWGVCEPQ